MSTLADATARASEGGFSRRIIDWQRLHGRHGLPWQATRDAYRVWLSEVMLQQTQVTTVLGYYARFLERFPDVGALARAQQSEVLALWSGLGYYSRARNLHRCAQDVVRLHGGEFPRDSRALQTLPGIGASTAAAIAAFCFGERISIMDGNVKRVLARLLGHSGDLASARELAPLSDAAHALLPARRDAMPPYTQALMDLGATLCTPRQPRCERCPVADLCVAAREGEPTRYPVKTRSLRRQRVDLWLLLLRRADGAVWMAERPQRGIWAGLWCVPSFDSEEALRAALQPRQAQSVRLDPPLRHVLTHRDLDLHPAWLDWAGRANPPLPGRWQSPDDWSGLGLPVPIRRLLAG